MPSRDRLFKIHEEDVEQILLADNSDDEDNLPLDEEDVSFLVEDVDNVGEEVIIERPLRASTPIPSTTFAPAASTPVPQNRGKATSSASSELPKN